MVNGPFRFFAKIDLDALTLPGAFSSRLSECGKPELSRMTKALIADMAAVLIEAVAADESLADADRILRMARFGTGAIVAFRGAAVALATQPETQNGTC